MTGTILIADDEPLARRTLRTHLCDLGCTGPIHEAADGITAIAIANGERPDLIFLDIVMPGATGLQVLEQLDYEPQVIFTTAHDEYAVTAFELGALDYVLKPFGRDRLERVIERARGASNGSAVPILSRARETLQPARTQRGSRGRSQAASRATRAACRGRRGRNPRPHGRRRRRAPAERWRCCGPCATSTILSPVKCSGRPPISVGWWGTPTSSTRRSSPA